MSDHLVGVDFHVDRQAWSKTRFVDSSASVDPAPGDVLLRVDRFAFTSNNITYAAVGEALRYWDFFPAEDGWGRLPVMGFGDVIASAHDDVAVGTRVFGFFPMSRYLTISPSRTGAGSIEDGAPHRQPMALVYRQYNPVASDPLYDSEHEDEIMLLRGLFMTSFLAEDFLADSDYSGAKVIVISSASSKTAISMAYVAQQNGDVRTIGLTSERNRAFVQGLGFYDEVRSYAEVGELDASMPAVYVDLAGNGAVSRAVHEHYGSNLKYSQRIGSTHWEAAADDAALPGPDREFFFAPGQIAKRISDWGPQGLQERIGESFQGLLRTTKAWLQVERGYGRKAVDRVYREMLAGDADPNIGHVLSLHDDEDAAAGRS